MSGRNTARSMPKANPRKRTIDRALHVLEEMMFTSEVEAYKEESCEEECEVTIVEDPSEAPTQVIEFPPKKRSSKLHNR